MTQNKRIIVNIIATYGRSLLSLVLGLLSGRWLLMALGVQDYGLLGLIGGLAVVVTFLNGLFSSAIGRFYAVSIGAEKNGNGGIEALEDCRKWFSTAVLIHSVLPTIMLAIGYPLGLWAIKKFLAIPSERLLAAIWVWRFTCAICYANMISVPYSAMYGAKQEIAELTVYSVAQSLALFCFIWYMVSHPSVWLVKYAAINMIVGILPKVLICLRAGFAYPECRVRLEYMFDVQRVRQLALFAGSKLWGSASQMSAEQLMSILVNKRLGIEKNAAMTIGNTVSSHSNSLASSLCGAFWPVVANKYGDGDLPAMRRYAMCASRFGTVLSLLFVIPLALEIRNVLVIWLTTPPPQTATICLFALGVAVLNKMTDGHWMVIFAVGRIGWYELVVGFSGFLALVVAFELCTLGFELFGIGMGLLIMQLYITAVRIYFARRIARFSIREWVGKCVVPSISLACLTSAAGSIVKCAMEASFARICLTVAVCETVFVPLVWFCFFDDEERNYLSKRFRRVLLRV